MDDSIRLYSASLLNKYGFDDGATLDDVADALAAAGIPEDDVDWHAVLIGLVRDYVGPKFVKHVVLVDVETSHNPIRISSIDGVNVESLWTSTGARGVELEPEFVDIPMGEVVRRCSASRQPGSTDG